MYDAKILAKVLAVRLNRVIHKLVHMDQAGFIANRSTSLNIRRAFLNLQSPTENEGSRAVLTLDVSKAFDSVEWGYIWRVLGKFGFGPSFIGWIKMLYDRPKARLKINNEFSDWFELERGTRQGCPLSPLLFALAMEHLAISVRESSEIIGFQRRTGKDRIALYADDILLFLGDMSNSLLKAMRIVESFGSFTGLEINWEKSELLPIDPISEPTVHAMPQLVIVDALKYLGIVMMKDPNQYISKNLIPLLRKFKQKIGTWKRLPLSVAGRCRLIKMIWMPQLLYVLHNSPVWICKSWFIKIKSLFRELIWKRRQARIHLRVLQLPMRDGGYALPHPERYFLATQLQQLVGCGAPAGGIPKW